MIKLTTIEGYEVDMAEADHTTLSAWPGVDLSCLMVVSDQVHPIRRDGTAHLLSLEAILKAAAVRLAPGYKVCTPCGARKPLEAFRPALKLPDSRKVTCRACENKRRAIRRAEAESFAAQAAALVSGPPGPLLTRFLTTGKTGRMRSRNGAW